jgi:hypothetical protein
MNRGGRRSPGRNRRASPCHRSGGRD